MTKSGSNVRPAKGQMQDPWRYDRDQRSGMQKVGPCVRLGPQEVRPCIKLGPA